MTQMQKQEKLLDPTGSLMMPPPGLQIYICHHVTLNFDLLTPKLDRFIPLLRGQFMPTDIKTGSLIFTIFCSQVW